RFSIDRYLELYDIVPVENTDAEEKRTDADAAKETEKSAKAGETQAP
ncbi:MAG: hypothetical protein JKY34_10015, partial [Kordiimonadaceae bacterium]|nr:hypothetical protein [Kordiimonadaceae bacterium]